MNRIVLFVMSVLFFRNAFSQDIKEIFLDKYNKLAISGSASVRYHISDTSKMQIKGNENDIEKVQYSQEGDVVQVKTTGNIKNPLIIHLFGKGLHEVICSGASSFKSAYKLEAEQFSIDCSGASGINILLQASRVSLIASGASDISLRGEAKMVTASLSGASSLKAYELKTDTCVLRAAGASSAKIYAFSRVEINSTGSSTVKFKGEPKDITVESAASSKVVKILNEKNFVESGDSTKRKTTIRYKNKHLIIMDNNVPDSSIFKYGNDLSREHWQGLWVAFAGYTNPQQGFSMNTPYNYMELDYARSFNIQWNLGQTNINLYKKYIQLSTGLGFHFNNLAFRNKTRLNADSSFTWGIIDSSNTYSYRKNRFKQSYIAVPLLLNFNSSKMLKNNFHLTLGVVGKYLLNSKTKQTLVLNSDEYRFRRKDSYNLNPFQFDAYASIGYRNVTLFAQYAINPMFSSGRGPELYSFSAGIRLISFD